MALGTSKPYPLVNKQYIKAMFQTTNQISYLIIVDLFLSIWLQLHGYSSGISLSRSAWLTGEISTSAQKKTCPWAFSAPSPPPNSKITGVMVGALLAAWQGKCEDPGSILPTVWMALFIPLITRGIYPIHRPRFVLGLPSVTTVKLSCDDELLEIWPC